MVATEARLNTSFTDDPFDMDMSGFLSFDGHIFLAREAWTPMKSKIGGEEEHFSFFSGTMEEDAPGSLIPGPSFFTKRKTWSSLVVVLLLHATLACLFAIFAKPPAQSPKIIETQFVLLPGGFDAPGGGAARGGGPEAPKVAKQVFPAPAVAAPLPAVPVKQEQPKPHQAIKVAETLHPVQKLHTPVRTHPLRIARVFHHQVERRQVQSESSSTTQSKSPGPGTPVVSPGTGKETGGTTTSGFGHAGSGNVKGPGGTGPSEIAFGSPNGPRFLHQVAPAYPPLARRLQMQGTVLLRVTIDTRGRPVKVDVLKKAGFGMDEEAVKAVEASIFVPAGGKEQPLACRALLPIKFVLESS